MFEEKGLIKISVMYPFSEGKTFNIDYYETNHMPMVAGLLGANLVNSLLKKVSRAEFPTRHLIWLSEHSM